VYDLFHISLSFHLSSGFTNA